MRYLCALIEQLRDTQMLPKIAIVDPGANGGLDFSQRTAPVFALDLFYSLVRPLRFIADDIIALSQTRLDDSLRHVASGSTTWGTNH